jgi:hypothetical protein
MAFGAPFVVGFPVGVAYFANARPKLVSATRASLDDPSLVPPPTPERTERQV